LILIFHAFRRELSLLESRLADRLPLDTAELRGFRAQLRRGGAELHAVTTGMGPRRARESAARALDALGPADLIMSAGVAGALSADLKPGDLVLASRIIETDRETLVATHSFAAAPERLAEARQALAAANLASSTGALLTTHRVLATGAEKRRAGESTGAIAVDMESAAVAAEAAARDLSVVAIRAIIDSVGDELPGAGLHNEHGQIRPLRVAGLLLRRPGDLPKLARLARNMSRATRALADALETIAVAHALR
jgi:adenosylhomocysteine nucleosidase